MLLEKPRGEKWVALKMLNIHNVLNKTKIKTFLTFLINAMYVTHYVMSFMTNATKKQL